MAPYRVACFDAAGRKLWVAGPIYGGDALHAIARCCIGLGGGAAEAWAADHRGDLEERDGVASCPHPSGAPGLVVMAKPWGPAS